MTKENSISKQEYMDYLRSEGRWAEAEVVDVQYDKDETFTVNPYKGEP